MSVQFGSRGEEVRALQNDLNALNQIGQPSLMTDGVFGMKTKDRVCKFQTLNHLKPDGIVGPKTLGGIKTARQRMPGAPPPLPGFPSPVGGGGMKFESEMKAVFEQKGQSFEWAGFFAAVEQGSIPPIKIFLGAIGRVEDARALASFYLQLRKWGMTGREMQLIFSKVILLRNDQALKLFATASEPAGKFAKVIGFLGSAATVAGYLVLVIECIGHASRGDYSIIMAELYKFGMGKAVPWAAMVEGLGSLLDGVVPENTRQNNLAFKILRSLDPIGLGASAVDSIGVVAGGLYEMLFSGRSAEDIMIPRLTKLVARMKQGPTSIFAEIGENCGDALYEISIMEDIAYREMLDYSWMELKEFFGK